jgi:hypothetical protein
MFRFFKSIAWIAAGAAMLFFIGVHTSDYWLPPSTLCLKAETKPPTVKTDNFSSRELFRELDRLVDITPWQKEKLLSIYRSGSGDRTAAFRQWVHESFPEIEPAYAEKIMKILRAHGTDPN